MCSQETQLTGDFENRKIVPACKSKDSAHVNNQRYFQHCF